MSDKQSQEKGLYGILNIPTTPKKNTTFAGLDEESFLIIEELRQRVEAQRKTFTIRELEREYAMGLLVGQSEQILIFVKEGPLSTPQFFYIKRSSIDHVEQPDFVTSWYQREGRTPPALPLYNGLEFMIGSKANGYVLTCDQGVIDNDISYEGRAREFSLAFPPVAPKSPKPRQTTGKDEDSGAFANLGLRPWQTEPKR